MFSSSFLIKLLSFPGMVRPVEQAPICMCLEEAAMCAAHKVLMIVELYSVGDPQRILDTAAYTLNNPLIKYYCYINQLYCYQLLLHYLNIKIKNIF